MVLAHGAANIVDQFFGWHTGRWGGEFQAHLHSPWGYDEPEILRTSKRQFGPIGADAGQLRMHLAERAGNRTRLVPRVPLAHFKNLLY